MANDDERDPKTMTASQHQRAVVKAAWLEWRVTTQLHSETAPDDHFKGPEGWFKKDELGLKSGDTSIFHTTSNLKAINKKNRADLARREGQELAADKKKIEARAARPPRDKYERDKAVRKLMRSAGIKVHAGALVRAK